jgi:hypothetical protein
MTLNRRFNFSDDNQITAQKADNINNFLWVAFAQNTDGNCIIEKEAKFHPTQTYFSLERAVTEVNAMDLDSSKLYVSYNDSSLLGEIISKNNPLTSTTEISKGAIVESPIDVLINGTDLWYLLPGNASGTNAKLLKYNTSGVLQQTVDLSKSGEIVVNAKSMTIDSNDDIWIGTYETPAKIVRVFEISGGLYDFTIDETLIA